MRPNKLRVTLQRSFVVLDADAAPVVKRRDISIVLALIGIDDPVGCESRRATIRVVNDDNVLYSEQMLCDRDGPQGVYCAAASDDDREDCRRGRDAIAGGIVEDLSWKRLVTKQLCHGAWNSGSPRIVAVDHQRPERHRLRERLSRLHLVERRHGAEGESFEFTHVLLLLYLVHMHILLSTIVRDG